MEAVVIIPARLGSTRFPAKVLADETGKPLIQHVVEAATRAAVGRVVVATDSEDVAVRVRAFGGEVVLTSPEHPNGSSRLAEAVDRLGLNPNQVVVNVQGDEPEIEPRVIEAALRALVRSGAEMSTVASPIEAEAEFVNPNVVKLVTRTGFDAIERALYFSRSPIPCVRDAGDGRCARRLKHVGIYGYEAQFLKKYVALAPTPLEESEKLEQLRVLEHGFEIAVAIERVTSVGVDTPADYARFVARERARVGD